MWDGFTYPFSTFNGASQHGWLITSFTKCKMEVLIHSKNLFIQFNICTQYWCVILVRFLFLVNAWNCSSNMLHGCPIDTGEKFVSPRPVSRSWRVWGKFGRYLTIISLCLRMATLYKCHCKHIGTSQIRYTTFKFQTPNHVLFDQKSI